MCILRHVVNNDENKKVWCSTVKKRLTEPCCHILMEVSGFLKCFKDLFTYMFEMQREIQRNREKASNDQQLCSEDRSQNDHKSRSWSRLKSGDGNSF